MSATAVIAVFDFDGTLTRVDTLMPFLVAVDARRAARHVPAALVAARPGGAARDAAKVRLIERVLADEAVDRIEELGRRYVDRVVRRLLRRDVLAHLRAHQRLGHRTVLASATPEPIIKPAAARLGIDDVVCTRLTAPSPDSPRWQVHGSNCRGAEKLRMVHQALPDRAGLTVWAYGNPPHDDALLAWSDHPVPVRLGRAVRVAVPA
jgi:HAD superfamily hydrolase (TIGR01490 family)